MTPVVSITNIDLTSSYVEVTWELVEGEVTSVSLGWMEGTDSTRRRRSTIDGYLILQSDVPPNQTTIYVQHPFNTSVNNQFTLFAYEGEGMQPTGESPQNQGQVHVPEPTQCMSKLINFEVYIVACYFKSISTY